MNEWRLGEMESGGTLHVDGTPQSLVEHRWMLGGAAPV